MTVRKVDDQSSSTSVSNTVAETAIGSMALPVWGLQTTGGMRFGFGGTILNTTATATLTFRGKLAQTGGSTFTVLESSAIALTTSTKPRFWWCGGTVLANGTASQKIWGGVQITHPSTRKLAPGAYAAIGLSTAGVDQSLVVIASVTAQFSAASANLSVTREFSVLESVR